MAEAVFVRAADDERLTAAAAITAAEVHQLADGRAGYLTGSAVASGDRAAFKTSGIVTMPKTAGVVLLDGGRAYWDHSANAITYKKVNDRDFYAGRVVRDAASADTTCAVNLNIDPPYDLDINRDPCLSTIVGTAAAGAFGHPIKKGGSWTLQTTSTSEAQKVSLVTIDGFAIAANAIIEFAFRVVNDGAGSAADFNIGIGSADHASDADSIAEHVFLHLDANSVNINAQSKDGTTTVAATDTTLDYTEGPTITNRVEGWIDTRNPADIQIYVNGALVLGATIFTLGAGTGPEFLIAHLEKSSAADVYEVAVDWLRARYAQQ